MRWIVPYFVSMRSAVAGSCGSVAQIAPRMMFGANAVGDTGSAIWRPSLLPARRPAGGRGHRP